MIIHQTFKSFYLIENCSHWDLNPGPGLTPLSLEKPLSLTGLDDGSVVVIKRSLSLAVFKCFIFVVIAIDR